MENQIDRIIDDAVKARRLAINRLIELIPTAKRIDKLLVVIKDMNRLIREDSGLPGGDGSILPALTKLANSTTVDQEELLASIMSQLPKNNSFVQINNYQKVEELEIKTELTPQ